MQKNKEVLPAPLGMSHAHYTRMQIIRKYNNNKENNNKEEEEDKDMTKEFYLLLPLI